MLLEAELGKVHRRLNGYIEPTPCDAHGDEQDLAAANCAQEFTAAERERLRQREVSLVAALERVKDGTYGICTQCDHPIGARRLKAIPEVELCIHCAERVERDEAARHRAWFFRAVAVKPAG